MQHGAIGVFEGRPLDQRLALTLDPVQIVTVGPAAITGFGQRVLDEDARPLALVLVRPLGVQVDADDRCALGHEAGDPAPACGKAHGAHAVRRWRVRGSRVCAGPDSSRRLARKYFFGRRRRSRARSISWSARRSSASKARSKAWRGVAAVCSTCKARRRAMSMVKAHRIPGAPFGPFSSVKPTRTATGGCLRWCTRLSSFLLTRRRSAPSPRPSMTIAMVFRPLVDGWSSKAHAAERTLNAWSTARAFGRIGSIRNSCA